MDLLNNFLNSPNAGKVPDVTITTANTSGIAGTYGSSGPTEIFYLSGTGSLAMFENYNTVDQISVLLYRAGANK